jgi:hypothetical protein
MRKLISVLTLLAVVASLAAVAELAPSGAAASSHREAPLISQDPAADNTDTYIFRSPDNPEMVTLIANYYPYQGPAGGPNFYRFGDNVMYEFHINNTGDGKDQIAYRFFFKTTIINSNTFLYNTGPITSLDSPNWSLRQTYDVVKATGSNVRYLAQGLQTPPSNVGTHSIPDYVPLRNAAIYTIDGDTKVFAGQRADPFFADVGAIFDLLTIRAGIPAGFSSGGFNNFAGYNVLTIALQVPISKLTACGCTPEASDSANNVIGFWASASRPQMTLRTALGTEVQNPQETNGRFTWVQVSRLGNPLVNEVVIPMSMKDKFNAAKPVDDVAAFAGPVLDPELAKLFNLLYGLTVPAAPRTDLVTAFLTGIPGLNQPLTVFPSEMLRLNVTTPLCGSAGAPACSPFGVIGGDPQGFPNGRRLSDDVVDIGERVVAGGYVLTPETNVSPNNLLGDGVNGPAKPYMTAFPYVADPYDGFTAP